MLLRAGLAVAALALFVAPVARAATLDLRGLVGSQIAAGHAGTFTYSGDPAFGAVTFRASPTGSDLTWSAGNGLGIDCPSSLPGCSIDSRYQIDSPEVLTISFAQPLFLTSLDLGLLQTTGHGRLRVDEQGSITGTGFEIDFDSDAATNGRLTVDVNRMVTSVRFVPDRGEWNDFSLASLTIRDGRPPTSSHPIPEPSSLLLLLIGGGIVAQQVRAHR